MKNKIWEFYYFICLAILFEFNFAFAYVPDIRAQIAKDKFESTHQIEGFFRDNLSKDFVYTKVPRGLIITIKNSVFFDNKSCVIKENSKNILSELGNIIKNINKPCVIEANSSQYEDSMQDLLLSIERGQNIAEFFINNCGVNTQMLRSVGFGDINPPENDKNISERIDIVILNY